MTLVRLDACLARCSWHGPMVRVAPPSRALLLHDAAEWPSRAARTGDPPLHLRPSRLCRAPRRRGRRAGARAAVRRRGRATRTSAAASRAARTAVPPWSGAAHRTASTPWTSTRVLAGAPPRLPGWPASISSTPAPLAPPPPDATSFRPHARAIVSGGLAAVAWSTQLRQTDFCSSSNSSRMGVLDAAIQMTHASSPKSERKCTTGFGEHRSGHVLRTHRILLFPPDVGVR